MKNILSAAPIGTWQAEENPQSVPVLLEEGLRALEKPLFLVKGPTGLLCYTTGSALRGKGPAKASDLPLLAWVPPLLPENLGNPDFCRRHGLRFAYIAGAMAHGISSEALVMEAGRCGCIGFFGTGGCSLEQIAKAIGTLQEHAKREAFPYGFNFLHRLSDPEGEMTLAELFLEKEVTTLCAAAFVRITPALVRYRLHGLTRDAGGRPKPKNRILAKISRAETAELFLEPPPEKIVNALLNQGKITAEEAEMAREIPMADDITAEADSGGHTDNRSALVLLGVIRNLRDGIQKKRKYAEIPCVGLGGGIAHPASCAAAFAMGADYVLAGSVHQGCVESDTSRLVKEMLSQCEMTDFAMAPSADMFEMGAEVQVLKKGTMFAMRSRKLYRLFQEYPGLEALPEKERIFLEEKIFRKNLASAWEDVARYWEERDPGQCVRAKKDPKHKMALLFRAYLGRSPLWAVQGTTDRKQDFQIWCGPAMGAFNDWTRGTFLAFPENRKVRLVAENFLAGAAIRLRCTLLKAQLPDLDPDPSLFLPMDADALDQIMKKSGPL